MLNLNEAASLNQVTVKLLIDFDKFLDLQRKLPDEYIAKRLAISLPIAHYDDESDETQILQRVIKNRRQA